MVNLYALAALAKVIGSAEAIVAVDELKHHPAADSIWADIATAFARNTGTVGYRIHEFDRAIIVAHARNICEPF